MKNHGLFPRDRYCRPGATIESVEYPSYCEGYHNGSTNITLEGTLTLEQRKQLKKSFTAKPVTASPVAPSPVAPIPQKSTGTHTPERKVAKRRIWGGIAALTGCAGLGYIIYKHIKHN